MNEEKETSKTVAEPVVGEKKRNAMVRYIAVMFAVAFALVVLSYLVQMKKNQTTITELNQTSLSALKNAETLQAENQELTEKNLELTAALADAQAETQEAQARTETEREAARTEGLEEGRTEGATQTQKAYDLLVKALAEEDPEAQRKLLDELAPLKGSLSGEALAQYEAMKS